MKALEDSLEEAKEKVGAVNSCEGLFITENVYDDICWYLYCLFVCL